MAAQDEHEFERLKRRMARFNKSYKKWKNRADRLRKDLEERLSQLMKQNELVPAVLESRLKSLDSAVPKVEGLSIDDVMKLEDFVGLRLVFLSTKEVAKAKKIIFGEFDIDSLIKEGKHLKFNEFGYRAIHIIARMPQDLLGLPSYSRFGPLLFEIQLRTLSQHNYEVTSRVLQYRQLRAAPPSVQRSLIRLAAIWELVDLEIERVSQGKLAYSINAMRYLKPEQLLNVDLLIQIVENKLPKEHRVPNDEYAQLFDELLRNGIDTPDLLLNLIKNFGKTARARNQQVAELYVNKNPAFVDEIGKAESGIYYSQVGLVWNMLKLMNQA